MGVHYFLYFQMQKDPLNNKMRVSTTLFWGCTSNSGLGRTYHSDPQTQPTVPHHQRIIPFNPTPETRFHNTKLLSILNVPQTLPSDMALLQERNQTAAMPTFTAP